LTTATEAAAPSPPASTVATPSAAMPATPAPSAAPTSATAKRQSAPLPKPDVKARAVPATTPSNPAVKPLPRYGQD
jgi:hypothetical protein